MALQPVRIQVKMSTPIWAWYLVSLLQAFIVLGQSARYRPLLFAALTFLLFLNLLLCTLVKIFMDFTV